MKKTLLFTLIFTCFFGVISAQECLPDSTYINEEAGFYPLAPPVGSPASLQACINIPYQKVITAIVPDIIYSSFSDTVVGVELISLSVDTIEGLPSGITYACEPPDCFFPQLSAGCIQFSGTPNEVGTFPLVIHGMTNFVFDGMPTIFPYSIPSGSDVSSDPQYIINVCSEDMCNQCIVGTEDAFKNALGMHQNIPNPFSTTTSIMLDSQLSGEFDFKVFDVLGKVIYNEQVQLSVGENTLQFDAGHLDSGMYFYTIGQGSDVVTKRMVVSR